MNYKFWAYGSFWMTCSVMCIWEWGAGRMITVYEFCGWTPYTTFPKQWFVVSCVQRVGSWVLSSILVVSFSWNITNIYVTWYKVQNCLSICIMTMAVCAGRQIFHSVWQAVRLWGNSHYTLRFWTSPFSKIFSCVIIRRWSHWKEYLRHISILYLLDLDNVNSLTSPPLKFECACNICRLFFFLRKWVKNW